VEAFEILDDALRVENFSGWEFEDHQDWSAFVCRNNEAALSFIEANPGGPSHGYILTTVSEEESKNLRSHSKS
jgi:hypothetical protein